MKRTLKSGFVAIAAALLATGAATPAMAQKGKPPTVKLSKPVQSFLAQAQPLLVEAQAAQQAGDKAGAAAKAQTAIPFIDQADAVPNKTADDTMVIGQLRLNAAILSGDNVLIEKALETAVASGRLSPEDNMKYIRNIGAMALQRNDYAKATAQFEKLLLLNPNDAAMMVEVAELQRRQKQNDKAVATLQQAIKTQEATGTKADESWYRRALAIAYDAKLPAHTTSTSEALVRAYPNATNWRDVLIIFRDTGKWDDQGNLDILRLMRANSALAGERDYAEYADTAATRGLPGEANSVLDEGIAKGALQAGKPLVKELKAAVAPKVASDKASLASLEREAGNAKTGRPAANTADAWLGYGNFAKAAELYKMALQKGGVDAAIVNTRLGYALARTGDKAGAAAAFKAVTGVPRDQLAKYWQIWLASQA